MTSRILAVGGVVLAVGCSGVASAPGDRLPFYDSADLTPRWTSVAHRVGDFALVTQTGETLTARDLDGHVHVASFIYTSCAGICPTMVAQLSKVQTALANRPGALLVSYTVTPQRDSPLGLATFGQQRGIDPARWKLVTGGSDVIHRLARTSYFADDRRLDAARPLSEQFLHTEKVLLVDGRRRLRGVYNGTLSHEIDKLLMDLDALLAAT